MKIKKLIIDLMSKEIQALKGLSSDQASTIKDCLLTIKELSIKEKLLTQEKKDLEIQLAELEKKARFEILSKMEEIENLKKANNEI